MRIDNSRLTYIPVELPCGVKLKCRPSVLTKTPQILSQLCEDATNALRLLPNSVHPLVKRSTIWVNSSYAYGSTVDPIEPTGVSTHHGEAWLFLNKDRREKRGGIEVYNCEVYGRMRLHWNGCGLLLHELCHLVHQFVLEDGLDNVLVKDLLRRSRENGKYDRVLRRDWIGQCVEVHDTAYALVDHKEFFAEMSVAFLSDSYHHLDDAATMEDACPKFLSSMLVESSSTQIDDCTQADDCIISCVDDLIEEEYVVSHCNKMYPFTRGQLRAYDPHVAIWIQHLWEQVENWRDPHHNIFAWFSTQVFNA